jgi:hypothetical protein
MDIRRETRVLISTVGTWAEFKDWARAIGRDLRDFGISDAEIDALNLEENPEPDPPRMWW